MDCIAGNAYRVDSASFNPDSTDLVDPSAVKVGMIAIAAGGVKSVQIVGHACEDGSPAVGLRRLSIARAMSAALVAEELGEQV